jgi:hypothetical protein
LVRVLICGERELVLSIEDIGRSFWERNWISGDTDFDGGIDFGHRFF